MFHRISLFRRIILSSFWCIQICSFFVLSQNRTTTEECVEKNIKANPELANRFDRDTLAALCNRSRNWFDAASDKRSLIAAQDFAITPRQHEYLNHLRTCQGLDCFVNATAICGNRCNETLFYRPRYVTTLRKGSQQSNCSEKAKSSSNKTTFEDLYIAQTVDVDELLNQIKVAESSGSLGGGNGSTRVANSNGTDIESIARICHRLRRNISDVASDLLPVSWGVLENRSRDDIIKEALTFHHRLSNLTSKCNHLARSLRNVGKKLSSYVSNTPAETSGTCEEDENDDGTSESENRTSTINEHGFEYGLGAEKFLRICANVLNSTAPNSAFPSYNQSGPGADRRLFQTYIAWKKNCRNFEEETEVSVEKHLSLLRSSTSTSSSNTSESSSSSRNHASTKLKHSSAERQTKVRKTSKKQKSSGTLVSGHADIVPDSLNKQQHLDPASSSWQQRPRHRRQDVDIFEPLPTPFQIPVRRRRPPNPLTDGIPGLVVPEIPSLSFDIRSRRKEYRMLTDEERWRFHAALNQLKNDKIDGISKYDLFVIYHIPVEAPGAHWGAAFLPWHRELLKQFEVALRNVDPLVSLPYWDSTLDEGLPTQTDSILWTHDFLGNGDNTVRSGPFADWETTRELVPGLRRLFRDIGGSPFGGLFRESDINFALTRANYGQLTSCIDPTFEMVHGVVHMFVGGFMSDIGISPNDPAFFLHHGFIDFVWEEFRLAQQNRAEREADYPPNNRACNSFHASQSQMRPFAIRNIAGLSNNYTDLFYTYEPRPTCSDVSPTCGSQYLFCENVTFRCLSKIAPGGACTGFESMDACLNSVCSNGVCTRTGRLPMTPSLITPRSSTPPPVTTRTTRVPETTTTFVLTTQRVSTEEATTAETTSTGQTTLITVETTVTSTRSTTTAASSTTTNVSPTRTTTTTTITTTTTEAFSTTAAVSTVTTTTTESSTTSASTSAPWQRTRIAGTPITNRVRPTTTTSRPSITRSSSVTVAQLDTVTPIQSTPSSEVKARIAWFTITVVDKSGKFSPTHSNRSSISSTGQNVPVGYTTRMEGNFPRSSAYPSWNGAGLVQVLNPIFTPDNEIRALIEVTDKDGSHCQAKCLREQKTYVDCEGVIRLGLDTVRSDPIQFSEFERSALENAWTGEGLSLRREPDYLIFQC